MARDPFREPWSARRIAGIVALSALLAIFFAIVYLPSLSPANKTFGVVRSSGPTNVGSIYGGTRDTALVRLADGRVVLAYVNEGGSLPPGVGATLPSGPLLAGDAVTLLEQPRIWGPPSYEIIARNRNGGLRTQPHAPLQ